MLSRTAFCCVGLLLFVVVARAGDIPANTDYELHMALRAAKAGDHIRVGPGPFKGGFYSVGLNGTKEQPIRISGPSVDKPAIFHAEQAYAMQLVAAIYIEVENFHITRANGSGLMFDDGGKNDFSCHHITIRNVRFDDIGPKGGACSIKMAGVADFHIASCTFRDWGLAGDAIDGVGCKNGVVEKCTFLPGRGSVAVQFKGGSESVVIRDCVFDDLPSSGINIGGSTGMVYFRPKPMGFEARKITVEHNLFIGCDAPIIFANIDGSDVRFNTIYLPTKWAFRIHQQTTAPDFTPCRNGRVEDNIIVFRSTQWLEGGINVGPKTAPETFTFARNVWYCIDNPAKSTPHLPSKETDAIIGKDPQFVDPAKKDFSLKSTSSARGKGHTAAAQEKGSK